MSLKRSFDIAVAGAGLVLGAPIVLPVAVTMAFITKSSPLFVQERIGQHGKPFKIFKIKTMRDAFNDAGEPLPDEQRVSRVGAFLRKTRLDEIPQFFNVLKGDMSLVGPRPIRAIWETAADPVRQSVKPGLTGLYQISGANSLTREKMVALDHAYIDTMREKGAVKGLFYDIGIFLKTPLALVKHRSAPHHRVPPP